MMCLDQTEPGSCSSLSRVAGTWIAAPSAKAPTITASRRLRMAIARSSTIGRKKSVAGVLRSVTSISSPSRHAPQVVTGRQSSSQKTAKLVYQATLVGEATASTLLTGQSTSSATRSARR
jgi:hypothetical protein